MEIAIVLFDGFDNLDAVGPFEVFSHAERFGAEIGVGLYTLTSRSIVTSSHGLRVEPDGQLQTAPEDSEAPESSHGLPDLVVVPGGGWGSRAEEGAWAQVQRGALPDALAGLHAKGTTVASVCTGGMVLAHAGLTDDRPAVTHQAALSDLRDAGAEVVEARVVDDGDLVTAGGVTAGLDLALHLVERACGSDIADRVATEIEHQPQGDVYLGQNAATGESTT